MIKQDYKWLTEKFVAHRGLWNEVFPENSIPAFENAAKNNFGIETDVQMTADGVLVVFHDDTLKRMTGAEGKLCDKTLQELRQLRLLDTDCVIPTFDEFLTAANGANLVVEIKTHKNIGEVEQKVYNALKNYKGNYCIESFNPLIVRWFKKNAPEVVRGQLSAMYKDTNFSKLKKWLLAELKLCKWNGSQFIAYFVEEIPQCKAIKRFGKKIPIIAWTVRSQQQYDEMKNYFDNIIFDSYLPIRTDLQ